MTEKPLQHDRTAVPFKSISISTLLVSSLLVIFAIVFTPSLRGSAALRPLTYLVPRVTQRSIITTPTSDMCDTKYSAREEKEWNHLSELMENFHNHFRYEFNRVYTLADGGFHKEGMSLPRFLREAQQLAHHLDMHHKIEAHIFPVLGKKMPQFKAGARESGEHLKSHRAIHEGLDKYEAFLSASLQSTSSYNPGVLRTIMDGFRDVLFRHLDEEVHDITGQSLRTAGWTLQELKQIPM